MKQLTDQDVRQIVKDEMQNNYRSGAPFVPPHTHNGNDNLRVSNTDVAPGIINNVDFMVTPGTRSENMVFYPGIPNPKQVFFTGFAYFLDPFPPNKAIKQASIVGMTFLGKSNQHQGTIAAGTTVPNTVQSNTCTYFYLTGGNWIPIGSSDNINICSIIDENNVQIGSIQVIAWDNTSITITAPLNLGWLMQGNITIT